MENILKGIVVTLMFALIVGALAGFMGCSLFPTYDGKLVIKTKGISDAPAGVMAGATVWEENDPNYTGVVEELGIGHITVVGLEFTGNTTTGDYSWTPNNDTIMENSYNLANEGYTKFNSESTQSVVCDNVDVFQFIDHLDLIMIGASSWNVTIDGFTYGEALNGMSANITTDPNSNELNVAKNQLVDAEGNVLVSFSGRAKTSVAFVNSELMGNRSVFAIQTARDIWAFYTSDEAENTVLITDQDTIEFFMSIISTLYSHSAMSSYISFVPMDGNIYVESTTDDYGEVTLMSDITIEISIDLNNLVSRVDTWTEEGVIEYKQLDEESYPTCFLTNFSADQYGSPITWGINF